MDLPFYREYELPWSNQSSQERSFRRLTGIVFAVLFVLSAIWPFLPTPEVDPSQEEIPPRFAKLLLEQQPPPPPPPKPKEPEGRNRIPSRNRSLSRLQKMSRNRSPIPKCRLLPSRPEKTATVEKPPISQRRERSMSCPDGLQRSAPKAATSSASALSRASSTAR